VATPEPSIDKQPFGTTAAGPIRSRVDALHEIGGFERGLRGGSPAAQRGLQ
jgi:hypothetical protein